MKIVTKASFLLSIFFASTTMSLAQLNSISVFASPEVNSLDFLKYATSEQFVFDNLSDLKKSYSIPDIYFALDESGINADSQETLNDLADLMIQQAQLQVAVTAHCDSRMPDYNNTLVLKRAEVAKVYLVSRGVGAERIVLEKYGRPATQNPCQRNPGCSIAEQQLNRKAEFNIIVNGQNLAHLRAYND